MRAFAGLIALCWAASCAPGEAEPFLIRARLAPDAQTLQELDDSLPGPFVIIEEEGTRDRLPVATEVRTEETTRAPRSEPPKKSEEDPYAEFESEPPAPPAARAPVALRRPPPPLAPRVERPKRRSPPRHVARDVALGVGGAGLALSALTLGANVDSADTGPLVVAGVALGIGVIGLGTAGILTLVEENEKQRPRVRAAAEGIVIEF